MPKTLSPCHSGAQTVKGLKKQIVVPALTLEVFFQVIWCSGEGFWPSGKNLYGNM
jgi:hypothetical protein